MNHGTNITECGGLHVTKVSDAATGGAAPGFLVFDGQADTPVVKLRAR